MRVAFLGLLTQHVAGNLLFGHPKCPSFEAPQSGASPQAVMPRIWCDDCNAAMGDIIGYCQTPESSGKVDGFCRSNMQDKPEDCDFLVNAVEKIFCPHDPCMKVRYSQGHTPGAICNHGYIQCVPRPVAPVITPPPEVEVLDVDCATCNGITEKMRAWCNKNDALEDPAPGMCQTEAPDLLPQCKFVQKMVSSMFFPQSACDGLKCQKDGNLCNKPPLSCGGGGDKEKLLEPKAPKVKDYVLYLNGSNAEAYQSEKVVEVVKSEAKSRFAA